MYFILNIWSISVHINFINVFSEDSLASKSTVFPLDFINV